MDKDAEKTTAHVTTDEVALQLEELGYKQELQRNLGMVAVLGLSFAIMAVPFVGSGGAISDSREPARRSTLR